MVRTYPLNWRTELPKIIDRHTPTGKCTQGWQRTGLTNCIEEDLKSAELKLEGKTTGRERKTLKGMAMNREQWIAIVLKSIIGSS